MAAATSAECSYTTVDKSAWGVGPWSDEPDKVQWVQDPNPRDRHRPRVCGDCSAPLAREQAACWRCGTAWGLDCLIVRNHYGALCGYVGVPPGHPWHGRDYADTVRDAVIDPWDGSIDALVNVHGGLTYASDCQEDAAEAKGICHVPPPGRPGGVWWFGFDCNHAFDLAPGFELHMRELDARHALGPAKPWLDDSGLPLVKYRTISYVREECANLARQLEREDRRCR